MKNRIVSLIVSLFFICEAIMFIFLFINCIDNYQKYNITYEDLNYEKLTFDRYEQIVRIKSGDTYEIYFVEYDDSQPCFISINHNLPAIKSTKIL